MPKKPDTFTTLDLYLTAFLALSGVQPLLQVHNGRVVFAFPATPDLYNLMASFNGNANVPVAEFVTAVKTLRGRMLTLRGGNRA